VGRNDVDLSRFGAGVRVRMAYADLLRRQAIEAAMQLPGDIVKSGESDAPPLPPVKLPAPQNRAQRRAERRRLVGRRKRR